MSNKNTIAISARNNRNRLRKIESVSIGSYVYKPDLSVIDINGKHTQISGISKDFLDYLLENYPSPVSKAAITSHVWRDKQCEDQNFYKAIGNLRKNIGDSKPWKIIANPTTNFYTIVPKVKIHYRRSKEDFLNQFRNSIGVIFLLIMASAVAKQSFFADSFYSIKQSQRLTNHKGEVERAAYAPTHNILAYTHRAVGESAWNLIAKNLNTGVSQVLLFETVPNTYNTEPNYSPSASQIAWIRTNYKDSCQLMIGDFDVLSMTLSNKKEILNCSEPYFGRTPQWKSENSILISIPQGRDLPNGIQQINLDTGERNWITTPKSSNQGDYSLFYNQSANKMAYLRQSTESGAGCQLRIFDFDTLEDKLVKSYEHPLYSVAWYDEFSLIANGINGYEITDLEGNAKPIEINEVEPLSFPFSMGDYQVGFVKGNLVDKDINIVNLNSKSKSKELSSLEHDYHAVVAKLSNHIVFLSNRENRHQMFLSLKGKIKPIWEFNDNDIITEIAISPKGNFIAFTQSSLLSIIRSDGTLLHKQKASLYGLSFSYDEEFLAFGSKLDGQSIITKLSLKNKFKESIVARGLMPKFDSDSNIYYFTQKKSKADEAESDLTLNKIDSDGEIETFSDITVDIKRIIAGGFDVMEQHLYITEPRDKSLFLVKKSITTGETTTISELDSSSFSYSVKNNTLVTTNHTQSQNNFVSFIISK